MRLEDIKPDVGIFGHFIASLQKGLMKQDWQTNTQAIIARMEAVHVVPTTTVYNAFLSAAPDAESAVDLVRRMKALGGLPDHGTFKNLVEKAKTEKEARQFIAEMEASGMAVTATFFNRLIQLAADTEGTIAVFGQMQASGVRPSASTYSILAARSPNLGAALDWVRKCIEQGLSIGDDMTSTLTRHIATRTAAEDLSAQLRMLGVKLGPSFFSGLGKRLAAAIAPIEVIAWHSSECPALSEPLAAAIKTYADQGLIEDACEIAICSPHVEAAHALFRKFPDKSLDALEDRYAGADKPFREARALGYWAMTQDVPDKARSWFDLAKGIAGNNDVGDIDRALKKMDAITPLPVQDY